MIKFSVVMPMYNAEARIKKSIESIIKQTYSNWELIIVDDGSTDKSLSVCNMYSKNDTRIKVFSKENEGPGKTRNYGINKSTGDYICFLDSDDYFELDYFETLNKVIENNNYDTVFFNIIMEKENGTVDKINSINKYKTYKKEDLIKAQMMGVLSWGPCLKVTKSEIVKKCEFSNLSVGEEAIYSYNVLELSSKIGFVDKELYHYVYNNEGQHTKGGSDPWHEVANNIKKHLEINGKINEYDKAINSLALRALTISIYRYSNSDLKLGDKIKEINNKIEEYKKEYKIFNIEKKLIDRTTKIIMFFIKYRLILAIIMASKLKSKNR